VRRTDLASKGRDDESHGTNYASDVLEWDEKILRYGYGKESDLECQRALKMIDKTRRRHAQNHCTRNITRMEA
jgi:hypothetical protein